MGKLQGKVALVTGAGQGVGRGIAIALAKEGACLAIVGRTLMKCERTADEIIALGGRAIALACDVGSREQVDGAIAATIKAVGRIDVLVNNAHTSRPMVGVEQITDKDMHIAMKGSYGTLYFMQAAFEQLKANRGRVINVGSIAGVRGDAGFGAYAMAKESVRALSRAAAREWGPLGITVNVVCPYAESPGIDYMIEHNPEHIHALTADTSLKRLGRSEQDVGRTVAFLASEDGGYITGQTIHVDGGMWIAP
jgi:NAD(P)-dependent dehydrogenase (short-subunit alcohol dehydrogenase family)